LKLDLLTSREKADLNSGEDPLPRQGSQQTSAFSLAMALAEFRHQLISEFAETIQNPK